MYTDKIFKYILFIPLVLAVSCKKDRISEFTDFPIIEAYLVPGDSARVKISRQVPFTSGVSYSEDNSDSLFITIDCDNQTYILTPVGDGTYVGKNLLPEAGKIYHLAFRFNSKEVKAYTQIPEVPLNFTQSDTSMVIEHQDSTTGPPSGGMPDPLELTWDNPDNSYYIVVIENIESTLDPIRDFGDETPPGNRFRKSPTKSSGLQIGSMEFQYYGTHRLILYHVLPDYATLYENQNNSSQNLTNPSTSIQNGYGIFTGLNTDTLFIEIKP
jgi:hypothetical protein